MKTRKNSKNAQSKKKKTINTTSLYVLLVVMFVLYLLFEKSVELSIILGAILFFLIISILIIEISNGFTEEGFKKNIIEIAVAIIIVIAFWYGLKFLLNTSYPLDVVPSCSMLSALHRGDMIILHGANQTNIKAPVVDVSQSAWAASFSNVNNESLECVAYVASGSNVRVSQFVPPGGSIGLLKSTPSGSSIIPSSTQNGLVKYTCGVVNVTFSNGTIEQEASTTAITIGNTTISGDKNNSIIVYQTVPQDLFYKEGDSYIVHRAYALINVSGTYYVLTKGDNNPGLDIQYQNTPANITQVGGKVIASIPYLGYVKLILSNNFVEPTGCNYTTQN